jgi:phosphopantetheinyl transferase (holo-ACP synthase)
VEILQATDGAPEVSVNGHAAAVTISLSHRSGVAICAVAPTITHLGCDVESVEPRSHEFVTDYFTAEEQAQVARTTADEHDQIVTLLWSAKESALKALRAGLRLDTRTVIVNVQNPSSDHNQWSALSVRHIGYLLPKSVLPKDHLPRHLLPQDFRKRRALPGRTGLRRLVANREWHRTHYGCRSEAGVADFTCHSRTWREQALFEPKLDRV